MHMRGCGLFAFWCKKNITRVPDELVSFILGLFLGGVATYGSQDSRQCKEPDLFSEMDSILLYYRFEPDIVRAKLSS